MDNIDYTEKTGEYDKF